MEKITALFKDINFEDPMSILKFLFGAFVINVIWEIIF